MARLQAETLERIDRFADRMLDVAKALEEQKRSARIIDQVIGCGTAPGANLYQADEAMSRADFNKCLAICVKELNECHFWLKLCLRRGWFTQDRMLPLIAEAGELKRMFSTMLGRSRRKAKAVGKR